MRWCAGGDTLNDRTASSHKHAFSSATATETAAPSLTVTANPTSLPTLNLTPSLAPTATKEPSAERIPIIEYHYSNFRLSDQVMMTADWYKGQIQWLADNGFTTLNASDLVDYLNGKKFPVKSVILSFDIGTARRADFETVIIPTLKHAHFKAFFFVLVNDNVITDTCGKDDRYCWEELRQWQSVGIISVESHGVFHPDYATLKPDETKWDSG